MRRINGAEKSRFTFVNTVLGDIKYLIMIAPYTGFIDCGNVVLTRTCYHSYDLISRERLE